jgi:hypothetical protein
MRGEWGGKWGKKESGIGRKTHFSSLLGVHSGGTVWLTVRRIMEILKSVVDADRSWLLRHNEYEG